MRLRRLKVFGFKSFADKVIVDFHDGITGIVGPNGCGKSNISDAIRWVLGEQSAKSMRGSRMPDIIFAGTAKRKALNFAEVSITFSNESRILPIDYEEVEVTRRLHRSGESEYFINGQHVRLKDIQDLFLDSGVGRNSFSIFEQGKIDQVINYSPLERRSIFEDAAGILRFLVEKQRSMRKLEQVDLNMSRVHDIHKEVERQIIVKEQQVEKAKAYKNNRTEFEKLEKGLFLTRWDRLEKRHANTLEKQQANQEQLQIVSQKLNEHTGGLSSKKAQLQKAEETLRIQNENVYKTRSEREIKIRERQTNQQRSQEIAAKEKHWRLQLETLNEKRAQRQIQEQELKRQQEELEQKLSGLESVTKEQWEQVREAEHGLVELRKQQQEAHHRYVSLMETEKQIESELKQNSVRLEHNQERRRQLQDRKEQLTDHISELAEQITAKEQAVREASQDIDDQKVLLKEHQARLVELKQLIQTARNEIDDLRKQQTEAEARQKVLKRLRDEMEGFSPGTKRLLQESTKSQSPIFNKVKGLYELIAPKPGAEEAVSTVMKPYTQTLVASTRADFEQVLAYAKENNIKDFSILCTEELEESAPEENVASLLSKVLETPISRHFLKNIAMTPDVSSAISLVRQQSNNHVWTDDGAYVDNKQVVFYVTQGGNNVFLREAELKTLEKRIKEVSDLLTAKEEELQHLIQQYDQSDTERLDLDKLIHQAEMKLVEVNFAFQRAKSDRDRTQSEIEKVVQEIQSIESTVISHQEKLANLNERYVQARTEAAQHKESSITLNQEVDVRSSMLKQEQMKLKEKESHMQGIIEEHRKVVHAVNVLEVQDLESVHQQKRLEDEIEAGQKFQQEIQERLEREAQLLQDVEQALQEVMEASSHLQEEVAQHKAAIEQTEMMLEGVREEIKRGELQIYETNSELAQISATRETIEKELNERYGLTINDAKALEIVLDRGIEEAEKRIRELRRTMENSDDINMASIEEFEELKTRYEFLNQQLEDLQISKQELVEIITRLDGESRKMFQETFEKVRANFQKNFAILFSGGEADLCFTEAEDILEAGIEIVAKPPGKQMRAISLLSGGEKCLTAMALLFAIFEVKTAPFCILDEVDAPLDDTNISRFVNVVRQFTNSCQFVIITHNKRTMSITDRLFGVSMEERGVSKLLAIEFSKDEKREPVPVSVE